MRMYLPRLVIFLAYMTGFGSLIAFGVFCYAGAWNLVRLDLTDGDALLLDACLSLTFFIQHSVMVRKSFRRYLARHIPQIYIGAVYAISSGAVLLMVILCWQGTPAALASANDVFRWILRMVFLSAIAGFYWGTKALGTFDPLGAGAILRHIRGKEAKEMPLSIKGPYRYVRHPLYFFVLMLIWSYPVLTPDRLLFNILWTLWIYVGTLLEDRDLVAEFGESYRQYQRKVPMLVPWRISHF